MIAGGVQAPLRAATRRLGRKDLDPLVESVREASYPPPYPEAWYVVGRSIDFVNRPQFVRCAGNQWVVFRDIHQLRRWYSQFYPAAVAQAAE